MSEQRKGSLRKLSVLVALLASETGKAFEIDETSNKVFIITKLSTTTLTSAGLHFHPSTPQPGVQMDLEETSGKPLVEGYCLPNNLIPSDEELEKPVAIQSGAPLKGSLDNLSTTPCQVVVTAHGYLLEN